MDKVTKPDSEWKEALLVVAALMLTACSLGHLPNPGSKPVGEDDVNQRTTAFNPSGDARQDLREAYKKLNTAYPYRLTETTTGTSNSQPTTQTTRVAEFAAADRVRAQVGGIEIITIGDKEYSNLGGKWTETGKTRRTSEADIEKLIGAWLKDVRVVGTETVNGVPCFAYELRFEGTWPSGQPFTGTGKTWIGKADGRVHEADSELRISSYTVKSLLVYEYNVNIKVEKPAM